jgi:hypothetical protein
MSRTASDAAAAFADVIYADQQWVDAEFAEIVAACFGGPPAPPPPAPPRVPPVPGTPPPPPSRRPAPGPTVPLFPTAEPARSRQRSPPGGPPGRRARPLSSRTPDSSPIPAMEGGQAAKTRHGRAQRPAHGGTPRAGSPAAVCLPWHPPGHGLARTADRRRLAGPCTRPPRRTASVAARLAHGAAP